MRMRSHAIVTSSRVIGHSRDGGSACDFIMCDSTSAMPAAWTATVPATRHAAMTKTLNMRCRPHCAAAGGPEPLDESPTRVRPSGFLPRAHAVRVVLADLNVRTSQRAQNPELKAPRDV